MFSGLFLFTGSPDDFASPPYQYRQSGLFWKCSTGQSVFINQHAKGKDHEKDLFCLSWKWRIGSAELAG
jgi:hypothetical protein